MNIYCIVFVREDASFEMFVPDCHSAKAVAGHLFQSPHAVSVTVDDINGIRYLQLVRGRQELTINIPSENARLG